MIIINKILTFVINCKYSTRYNNIDLFTAKNPECSQILKQYTKIVMVLYI